MILAFFAWGAFLLFLVYSYSTASVLHPSLEGNGVESWDVVRNGPRHKIGNVLHHLVFRHLFFWATVHSLCRNQFRTILEYFKRSSILSIFQTHADSKWFKQIALQNSFLTSFVLLPKKSTVNLMGFYNFQWTPLYKQTNNNGNPQLLQHKSTVITTTFLSTDVWVWLPYSFKPSIAITSLEENVLELPAVNDPQIAALLKGPSCKKCWWWKIPLCYNKKCDVISLQNATYINVAHCCVLWHVNIIWQKTLPQKSSPWPQRSAHVVAIAIRVTHQNNGQLSRWPWVAMFLKPLTVCQGWLCFSKGKVVQVVKDRYLKVLNVEHVKS